MNRPRFLSFPISSTGTVYGAIAKLARQRHGGVYSPRVNACAHRGSKVVRLRNERTDRIRPNPHPCRPHVFPHLCFFLLYTFQYASHGVAHTERAHTCPRVTCSVTSRGRARAYHRGLGFGGDSGRNGLSDCDSLADRTCQITHSRHLAARYTGDAWAAEHSAGATT